VIVVGNVVEMGGNGGRPLLFYGGRYHRLGQDGADGFPGPRPERLAR
jgi:hypothetical protein